MGDIERKVAASTAGVAVIRMAAGNRARLGKAGKFGM
jgi:hypothetical protein